MRGREWTDLLELHELPDGPVADGEVGEELEGLRDDQLAGAPVLQVRDHLARWAGEQVIRLAVRGGRQYESR